jgi:hypothetical protein
MTHFFATTTVLCFLMPRGRMVGSILARAFNARDKFLYRKRSSAPRALVACVAVSFGARNFRFNHIHRVYAASIKVNRLDEHRQWRFAAATTRAAR